jgi:hypothetical protein
MSVFNEYNDLDFMRMIGHAVTGGILHSALFVRFDAFLIRSPLSPGSLTSEIQIFLS